MPHDIEIIIPGNQTITVQFPERDINLTVTSDLLDSTVLYRGYGAIYEYGNY